MSQKRIKDKYFLWWDWCGNFMRQTLSETSMQILEVTHDSTVFWPLRHEYRCLQCVSMHKWACGNALERKKCSCYSQESLFSQWNLNHCWTVPILKITKWVTSCSADIWQNIWHLRVRINVLWIWINESSECNEVGKSNLTWPGLIETGNKSGQSRFTGATTPDESNPLSRLNR